MKGLFTIFGLFSISYGTPILEWIEQSLPSEMSGGSIAGYYKGIVYGLSPTLNSSASWAGTWKIDLNTGKSSTFQRPSPRDFYKQSAVNAFTAVGQYIYFVGDNGGSSFTVLSGFNMVPDQNGYDWKVWPNGANAIEFEDGRSYEVLPCVTATIDGKYLIIMGGQLNGKKSSEVMFVEVDNPNNTIYGAEMVYPSSKFGCIAAHDGYLYKFGGSNTDDPAQGWKLDISNVKKAKDQQWQKIDVNLGTNLTNPTVLELEEDQLLYIIGGYDETSGSCTKTVSFLNITDDKNAHDPDYIVPQLIDGYCYGAGVAANRQFYLFGGSQYEKGTKTAGAVAAWQQTINNTTSPTLSPTPSPTISPPPTKSPTKEPTIDPTSQPSMSPSIDPTASPTDEPTNVPTTDPTGTPTEAPTDEPTTDPTGNPSVSPSVDPTKLPTNDPTNIPTTDPTNIPTNVPTTDPTLQPTESPTAEPTVSPTKEPTTDPTTNPTGSPTKEPTTDPTVDPTGAPTKEPTTDPTTDPTSKPTGSPTKEPTKEPTTDPTANPSGSPTKEPTTDPTTDPTAKPTGSPTKEPTTDPTTKPTGSPTKEPTSNPTTKPTGAPTEEPTIEPTNDPTTDKPSASPTITAPKSSGDGPSTNWIVVFCLIGFAALLIVVSCAVYCVKRYKSRVGRQEEALLQIM